MHHNATSTSSEQLHDNGAFATTTTKKKRRPAGTPDPEAEVVSLSPKTLLESDRYVCEICNQGFQRDQNLQMHRRRHKVPWQLLKRSSETATDQLGLGGGNSKTTTKKVYVCPEPSCLHHDPRHALGDLVGIKKHFRRKHSTHKQWVCDKCSKAYAVQSDYKAHLKTCGTRGHSCDCGRVFSRVESFIEHQDVCTVRKFSQVDEHDQDQQLGGPVKRSGNSCRTESSSSASTEPKAQLLPPPDPIMALMVKNQDELISSQQNLLDLSIGLGLGGGGREMMMGNENYSTTAVPTSALGLGSGEEAGMLREYANEQLRVAAAEKAYAEEARQQARRQVEVAELEFANAQRMRLQAHAELERAHLLKQHALTKINSTLTQITCPTCKLHFTYHHPPTTTTFPPSTDDSSSLAISYMSSPTTDGDGE